MENADDKTLFYEENKIKFVKVEQSTLNKSFYALQNLDYQAVRYFFRMIFLSTNNFNTD